MTQYHDIFGRIEMEADDSGPYFYVYLSAPNAGCVLFFADNRSQPVFASLLDGAVKALVRVLA